MSWEWDNISTVHWMASLSIITITNHPITQSPTSPLCPTIMRMISPTSTPVDTKELSSCLLSIRPAVELLHVVYVIANMEGQELPTQAGWCLLRRRTFTGLTQVNTPSVRTTNTSPTLHNLRSRHVLPPSIMRMKSFETFMSRIW